MATLYAKSSQLVVAARSAGLRQTLELYLVLCEECHDLLARLATRAREEGLDLSLVATSKLGCFQNFYQEGSWSEGYCI